MTSDRMNDTSLPASTPEHRDLPVGAGASIVIAVATSLVLAATLLCASLAPARAAERLPAIGGFDVVPAAITSDAASQSLSAIVVMAVLAAWLTVSADLWRALFNRVKSWDRPRS